MNVSDAIRLKRVVRKFQDKPLPVDVVQAILNAGRRSQSSKNTQAWQFIAIQDKETLKVLSQCGEWAGHIAGAALCVAILTPEPTEKFQTMFDAGQAMDYKNKIRNTTNELNWSSNLRGGTSIYTHHCI